MNHTNVILPITFTAHTVDVLQIYPTGVCIPSCILVLWNQSGKIVTYFRRGLISHHFQLRCDHPVIGYLPVFAQITVKACPRQQQLICLWEGPGGNTQNIKSVLSNLLPPRYQQEVRQLQNITEMRGR